MEPKALDTLKKEAHALKEKVKSELNGNVPKGIEYIFNETAFFFLEETLANWRRTERYDELIDYILWNYAESGGTDIWKQVLLDLRLKKDEDRAHRLLDGLYHGRASKFRVALKNYKKYPNNHLSAAACYEAKGSVMTVLYEHGYLLENKPDLEQSSDRVALVRSRIWEISNEQKIT